MITRRQRWALHCATGLDTREMVCSIAMATQLIEESLQGISVADRCLHYGAIGTPKNTKDWAAIWGEAYKAGIEAGKAAVPTPMGVVDEFSGQRWVVDEGVCGFAEVKVKGNTSFGRWAKKHGFRKAYDRGLYFWVSEFGQSYTRKLACAKAIAEVLKSNGVDDAWATGRLD